MGVYVPGGHWRWQLSSSDARPPFLLSPNVLLPCAAFFIMASLLKASQKAKGKRKADDMNVDHDETAPVAKKPRNKQRVLMLSSRGINHRMRHLMNDLEALLPHVKKGELLLKVNDVFLRTGARRFEARLQKSPQPPP